MHPVGKLQFWLFFQVKMVQVQMKMKWMDHLDLRKWFEKIQHLHHVLSCLNKTTMFENWGKNQENHVSIPNEIKIPFPIQGWSIRSWSQLLSPCTGLRAYSCLQWEDFHVAWYKPYPQVVAYKIGAVTMGSMLLWISQISGWTRYLKAWSMIICLE